MRTRIAAAVLLLAAAPAFSGDEALGRFSAPTGELVLSDTDISDAKPWFDKGAAGINIRLTDGAAEALAGLTRSAVGQTMSFSVCGSELVSAKVRAAIEGGQIAAVTEGLGEATWYAQVLRGEVGCDGKPAQ